MESLVHFITRMTSISIKIDWKGRISWLKERKNELEAFSKLVVCIQALEFRTFIKWKLAAYCLRWRRVHSTSPFNWGSFFSVYLARHRHHLCHKTNKAFPLSFCTLQKLEGLGMKLVLYVYHMPSPATECNVSTCRYHLLCLQPGLIKNVHPVPTWSDLCTEQKQIQYSKWSVG